MTSVIGNPAAIEGLTWLPNGQSVLSGPLLALARRLDAHFLRLSARWGAREYAFPAFLPVRDLARLDYFHSFPHLVTFPVTLAADGENLRRFAYRHRVGDDGAVELGATAPVCDVLTPAACYHCYAQYRDAALDSPLYLTTRATCFRRERQYVPLQRQWSFSMREIVCIGGEREVMRFLDECRAAVEQTLRQMALPVAWLAATDPFFEPGRNAKYFGQKLAPVKTEMVFDGRLALGSVNFHRDWFGRAYGISYDGAPACSGCVAFGIERWLFAILSCFGPSEAAWPVFTYVPERTER
jgi:seryl-tRNA synthetase